MHTHTAKLGACLHIKLKIEKRRCKPTRLIFLSHSAIHPSIRTQSQHADKHPKSQIVTCYFALLQCVATVQMSLAHCFTRVELNSSLISLQVLVLLSFVVGVNTRDYEGFWPTVAAWRLDGGALWPRERKKSAPLYFRVIIYVLTNPSISPVKSKLYPGQNMRSAVFKLL